MLYGTSAIVIEIEGRFFCGVGKNGRIKTAWSLAGAMLFGPWRENEIRAAEDTLKAKGKKPKRMVVVLRDKGVVL
jgi:hypothetical protein